MKMSSLNDDEITDYWNSTVWTICCFLTLWVQLCPVVQHDIHRYDFVVTFGTRKLGVVTRDAVVVAFYCKVFLLSRQISFASVASNFRSSLNELEASGMVTEVVGARKKFSLKWSIAIGTSGH